ncbi:hydroxymethylglutaryl-CoA lyase [Sphingomonas sp.]|jgi:hydroxymethylglutaryl-CoA lyase|uniref:hydroxymethylglutaryl-CoA lyase n=1 Tax=Sphingomonas sp. TaxID=28214 RepID=UPI002D7FB6D4|nr:hydroxymethylglutaryl-CoA lyase [Sphingomonas sp.]HEU0043458.1 hydroxymethylglutaryl-CoA lyase [Sphingomonas sp.]
MQFPIAGAQGQLPGTALMVEIVEVGPRDGLQNESVRFSTAQKVALIERAVAAGARRIEVASFVRADRVPQMADAEAVIAALDLPWDVTTIGLVLNARGAARALATQVKELGAVCVASDAFAQRNQGQTSAESAAVAAEVIGLALRAGRGAQATIGAAFGCPFEGEVLPDRVVALAEMLAAAGPREIALADTIGVAVPAQVGALVGRVASATGLPVRVHLHNTRGMGIANAWAAIQAGATTLDASLGGIGGCPFAPDATGNIATEELVYLLDRSGVAHGHDLERTIAAARWLGDEMGRALPGLVSRAGGFPMRAS